MGGQCVSVVPAGPLPLVTSVLRGMVVKLLCGKVSRLDSLPPQCALLPSCRVEKQSTGRELSLPASLPADCALPRILQGEVVEQQFGEKEVCFRTLDLYTSAVLEASLDPVVHPKPEWRKAMEGMSEVGTQLTC